MKQLPIFKGWTVDARLKEFRRVTENGIEQIPFDSDEGDTLLAELLRSLNADDPLFNELAEAII